MTLSKRLAITFLILLSARTGFAFNGHQVAEGPLRLEVAPVVGVTRYDQPYDVHVAATNLGTTPLVVRLHLAGLVDEWRPVGATAIALTIPAGGRQEALFQIAAGVGAYSALYPVHIHAEFTSQGQDFTAQAVRVIETQFAPVVPVTRVLPVTPVPDRGTLLLTQLPNFRAGWAYFDQAEMLLPTGWLGQTETSRASCSIHDVARGAMRQALNMHPAWWQGQGTVFVDYRFALPAATPILFSTGLAIRDHTAEEPPSDGVTFRVWINGRPELEHHTDSKTWVDQQLDLSAYAGQEIQLRLESHPGPHRNTACDSAYWGNPAITVGPPPPQLSPLDVSRLQNRAEELIASGHGRADDEFVFSLADGLRAGIVLGPNGLIDGIVGLGAGDQCVTFDGLAIAIRNHRLGPWPSSVTITQVDAKRLADDRVRITHRCAMGEQRFDLTVELFADSAGLRVNVQCPERITDLASGPFNTQADRVYYGHGYCIVEPEAFRADFGGHTLSTSQVGFDFDRGVSLLTASDNPPDYLEVNPDQRVYALHTHLGATLTFVPSLKGIVDCATKYREMDTRRPSPGFSRKAGRFVFDVWGGRFADTAQLMKQMIAYGLTDSLLTMHVWQRWGYDYRLPDIYPPDPGLGTVEELRRLGAVCDAAGVPWGLHDNYIDYYPDAEAFSYDHICFTESGQPIKAWINTGRDAQSYRFRPDHIQPFVERNLQYIGPGLHPTHYFIDVFTSASPFDYYDRDGQFHSSLETRRHWGQAFSWIQAYLGPGTITTSEAGHDQLVGVLDGADCQHLNLTPDGGRFQIRMRCRDWERFPWFDLVLHDRFSLHGVGYPGRYEGGRSRRSHGIESDDYLSAELLLGHALMIDRSSMPRGAVRKYWLAQDFIRSIATDTIENVEFTDGDIHRITVTWHSGATVHVNRGPEDWHIAGRVLPQYGYYAFRDGLESSIERVNGVIVEQSRSADRWYVNARGHATDDTLFITPKAESANGNVTNITFEPHPTSTRPTPRQNTARKPIDFGPVTTVGAVRCEWSHDRIVLTPLPGEPAFAITLDASSVVKSTNTNVKSVRALDSQGQLLHPVTVQTSGSSITFVTDPHAFAFEVPLRQEAYKQHRPHVFAGKRLGGDASPYPRHPQR